MVMLLVAMFPEVRGSTVPPAAVRDEPGQTWHDPRAEFNGPCRAPAVLLQEHHQLIIDNNWSSRFTIRRPVQSGVINVTYYEDINSL